MIKIKKYQIEDYISDATQDALDLKADLVDGKVPASQLPSFVDDVIEVANYAALPVLGVTGVIYITLDTNKVYRWTGSVYVEVSSGVTNLSYTPGVSNGVVNSDTGSDATIPLAGTVNAGLFSAAEKSKLEGIAPNANVGVIPNSPITGATKTKITYDSKGLVTSGDDATTADISSSTNKRYVTDANLTVINNTSGTNTGDQGLQSVTDIGASTTSSITADSFIKSGGLATEYLMADGTTTTGGGGDFVPYTGATSDVNLGEFGIQLGNLEFDNTPTNIPTTAGSIYYNDADGTLDLILKGGNVKLQIGQETVIRVVNKTATNISLLESNYQAVRITGAQGQRPKVDLAQATNDVLSAETIGLVTETIANNQEGFITTSGLVRNINTTGSLQGETWLDGDILYLSPTVAGSITKIKPIAPNHLIIIGYVIHAHITQGTIFVKVDNGYELNELHNVKINGVANNNVLAYTSSTSIWENKTVETALGYTPANDASVVHIAGTEIITGAKTFTAATNISNSLFVSTNTDIAISAVSQDYDAITGETTNGIGVFGGSTNGLGGYFNTVNGANIAEFRTNFILKASVSNDGSMTAAKYFYSGGSIFPEFSQTFYINGTGATHYFGGGTSNAQNNLEVSNGTLKIGLQTASTIASFDSSKNVVSLPLATYPSLTELTYVKGVTSAIQTQLDGKVDENTAITGATKTKITYDSKGLVTAGADIATTDISDFNSATRAQVEAELVAGTNITITPSGTGATRQLTIAATGGSSTQGAFTVLANNTNATAAPTEHVFKSVAEQTYSGTITWSASAPQTILSNTYEWQQIGKMVNLRVNLSYSAAGTNQQVIITLPSDLPNPKNITGFTSASEIICFGSGMIFLDRAVLPASAGRSCLLRRNAANNGYELVVTHGSSISVRNMALTIQYFA